MSAMLSLEKLLAVLSFRGLSLRVLGSQWQLTKWSLKLCVTSMERGRILTVEKKGKTAATPNELNMPGVLTNPQTSTLNCLYYSICRCMNTFSKLANTEL